MLDDVHITVKGGHTVKDRDAKCPEIGVGHFNIRDFGLQPSYGLWARHVDGFHLHDVTLDAELPDAREAIILDDVLPGDDATNFEISSGAEASARESSSGAGTGQ